MYIKLLNLGFVYKGKDSDGNDLFTCESISVYIKGDKVYVADLDTEVTLDDLEELLLES